MKNAFFLSNCDLGDLYIVRADVSSIDGVKTFPSTTATSPENSDSFSILTKEFLNRPEGGEAGNRISQKPGSARNPARDNSIGTTDNKLPDSDESDDRQAYFYDKPKIPFEFDSTNIQINTVPPNK